MAVINEKGTSKSPLTIIQAVLHFGVKSKADGLVFRKKWFEGVKVDSPKLRKWTVMTAVMNKTGRPKKGQSGRPQNPIAVFLRRLRFNSKATVFTFCLNNQLIWLWKTHISC